MEHIPQKRLHQRTSVFLQSGIEAEGHAVRGTIRSLSATGASLAVDLTANVGDRVRLSLRNIGDVWGRIVWVKNKRIGVEFDASIDPAGALAAAGGQAVPTYEHVYNHKDYKRPGFGPQRMTRKD